MYEHSPRLCEKTLAKPFSANHLKQMLAKLAESGLMRKNRHGGYFVAAPLRGDFGSRLQTEGLLKNL
jgi:DNA-binding GntR family transcriptional regulator